MHKIYPLVSSVPSYNFLSFKEGGEREEKMFKREILIIVKNDYGLKPLFVPFQPFAPHRKNLKIGCIQVFLT